MTVSRSQPDTERVYLSVDQCSRGGLQLSVGIEHADGGGHGYRIFGPKYDGGGKQLRRHYLTDRDVQELTDYLKKVRRTKPESTKAKCSKCGRDPTLLEPCPVHDANCPYIYS